MNMKERERIFRVSKAARICLLLAAWLGAWLGASLAWFDALALDQTAGRKGSKI